MYVHTFVFIVLASMIVMLLLKCSTQLAYRVDVQNNINNTNLQYKAFFFSEYFHQLRWIIKGKSGVC